MKKSRAKTYSYAQIIRALMAAGMFDARKDSLFKHFLVNPIKK